MSEHDDRVPIASSSGGGIVSGDVSVAESEPLNEFVCSICDMSAPYELFSNKPPKRCSKKIKFREECYSVMGGVNKFRIKIFLGVKGTTLHDFLGEFDGSFCVLHIKFYNMNHIIRCNSPFYTIHFDRRNNVSL